jgi:4-methyl-5(b-hydroxyethyl)-thiazole monophosphate biosynthesis
MKKVLLLLANGFEVYEASAFIDVIGWNHEEGDGSTRLYTCGITPEVTSTFGQRFVVDYLLSEVKADDYDALAIPGGFEPYGFYKDAYSEPFLSLIREFAAQNRPIASICVGALPVAKSGLLQGCKATTYNQGEKRQQALHEMGAEVQQVPIVQEANIITSWGPGTAIDVAFMLLERLTSTENTKHVRKLMGF